jgi:hypothetical protein
MKVLEFRLEDAQQQRAKEAEMMTRIIESARIAGEQKVNTWRVNYDVSRATFCSSGGGSQG